MKLFLHLIGPFIILHSRTIKNTLKFSDIGKNLLIPDAITSGFLIREASTFDSCVYSVTNPAPEYRLASDAIIPAPPSPLDPAIIRTLPFKPLCEFDFLLGMVIFKFLKVKLCFITLFLRVIPKPI